MCYCQGASTSQLCDGNTDVCDTSTGVCFVQVAVSIDSESIADKYACIQKIFANLKQACLDGPIVKDYTSMQCCNETDQCNAHLNPPLPRYFKPS